MAHSKKAGEVNARKGDFFCQTIDKKITNLRTPQMTQPYFDPNGVSVHFTLCCHKCTHFAWPLYTYAEPFGSKTVLGLVVQLYSHNIIQSVYYTCTAF